MWSVVAAGISIDGLLASDAPLYALLVLAVVLGGTCLIRLRRRHAKLAAARAWTEPLDLQTLRLRMRIVDPEPQTSALPQTREFLDELRRGSERRGAAGVAGSTRRR